MKNKNIGINAILNTLQSCMSILFPLITYPYALRVLGVESLGKVSYGASIVSYFSLIAMLGVKNYGIREGAKFKDNRGRFNIFANELFTVNLISTGISYVLLLLCLIVFKNLHEYALLILVQSISLILTTISVDWINTVYEDFLMITIRSIVSRVLSLVLLFTLVHSPGDYYFYALLSVCSNGLTCVTNVFYVRRYAKVRVTRHPNFHTHIKPLLVLFANNLAISIYVNFDTTMLGWIEGDYSVGLYSVAVKIYTIAKNILIAIYTVTIPRLAYYFGQGLMQEYKKLYTDLWSYLCLILIPAGVGLSCISEEVIVLMGGAEYSESTLALQILSIALIIAILGGLVTSCLNITIGREKDNLIATVIAALINCGLNFIVIPKFSFYGAAFTTLVAELFTFVFCFIRVPNKSLYMDFEIIKKSLLHAIVGCLPIILTSFFVNQYIMGQLLRLIIIVPVSVILYALTLALMHDRLITLVLGKIKNFLRR